MRSFLFFFIEMDPTTLISYPVFCVCGVINNDTIKYILKREKKREREIVDIVRVFEL